ncbi:hypothetical protein BC827DRAFT_193856 [Russula dissimulans]|nr:hypothetical protein BC827DRAFT_193856 [Russula dissimulans]
MDQLPHSYPSDGYIILRLYTHSTPGDRVPMAAPQQTRVACALMKKKTSDRSGLCLIRVYALYSQSRRVLGFLTFTALISVVTGALFASRRNKNDIGPVSSSFIGCSHFTSSATGRYHAIAWACMSGFDIVIFSLTLYKAFKIGRGIRLLDTIVRDGAMYFFALFIMNLINIFAYLHFPHFLKSSATRLTNVLSTTLVSRMVLNLREQNSAVVNLPTTVETEHRFQAALPRAQQSTTSVGDSPSVCPSDSACQTIAIGTSGASY